MRALVVINPIAGRGRTRTIGACVDLAKSVLASYHYDADVRVTTGPADAYRFSKEAVESKTDLVIAWGGDGTVNGAASGVAGTGIPLAIIPGGSGNGLARDLSIPFDPARAFAIAATGQVRAIDAGDLHGSLFFNVAGVGLDARIAGRLATEGHRRGLMGYVLATIAELRSYEACAYTIRNALDANGHPLTGDIIERRALFIALANSRQYGSGAQIAPRALLDDGMMEVVMVEPQSGMQIARKVPALFRGSLREQAGIIMRSAATMEISCAQRIAFHVDGEPREGPNQLIMRTRRRVLQVKVSR